MSGNSNGASATPSASNGAAGQAAALPEPAFILQYGKAGTHKSTVAGELAAYGGVGLAPPTGMEPVWTYLRVPVAAFQAEQFSVAYAQLPALVAAGYFVTIQPRTLIEALSWLPWLRQLGVWCVVLDDVSLFAHDQLLDMKQAALTAILQEEATARAAGQKWTPRGVDGRRLYGEIGDIGAIFRRATTALSMVVIVNGHEKEDDKGQITPDFPGKVMGRQLVHGASAVIRSAPHPTAWGEGGIAHWCTSGATIEAKNRLAVGGAPAIVQPSLRALLVDTGRRVPRHPKLAWMDDVMHAVAERIEKGEEFPAVSALYAGWGRGAGLEPAHVSWAVREGHSLGQYRAHRAGGKSYWDAMTKPPQGTAGSGLFGPGVTVAGQPAGVTAAGQPAAGQPAVT